MHDLCDYSGKGPSEAVAGFPKTLLPMPFPWAHCALYHFVVIDHSFKNNRILNLVSPLSKSPNLRPPNTTHGLFPHF